MYPRPKELQDPMDDFEEQELSNTWWNLLGVSFLVVGLILLAGLALITVSGGIALFRWAIS